MIKLIIINFIDKLIGDCESILHPFDISKIDFINVQIVSDDRSDRLKKYFRKNINILKKDMESNNFIITEKITI